jgi:general secretion pathway protein D
LVLDKPEARLQIGDQVPIATQQVDTSDVTAPIVNTISFRDTGLS